MSANIVKIMQDAVNDKITEKSKPISVVNTKLEAYQIWNSDLVTQDVLKQLKDERHKELTLVMDLAGCGDERLLRAAGVKAQTLDKVINLIQNAEYGRKPNN